MLYQASDWGNRYHGLTCEEALGAGSAGPGKSLVLLADPLPQIHVEHERCVRRDHKFPLPWGGSTGWAIHFRRTFPMLELTIARSLRLFPNIDRGAHYSSVNSTWHFSSGYRLQFAHCKDVNDWENYMSSEYTHMAFDELVQFDQEQYDQLKTRVRSSDPVLSKMLKVRAMSNPLMRWEGTDSQKVRDPHWVRKYFVDPCPDGGTMLKKKIVRSDGTVVFRRRIYLKATLYDNPDKEFVRQYEETLLDAKPHIRQALLYGNWYFTAASYYDEWNDKLHVCEPFRVPADWPVFRALDWGFKKPGAIHWFALDEDDNLFVIRELNFQGKNIQEVSGMIEMIETEMGLWRDGKSAITGPADTQIWEKRGEGGLSKAEQFAAEGINWVAANKKSREANAMRLHNRLADHDNGTATPGLVLFRTCKTAIKTIPAIQTDPQNPEAPMDGGEDHTHDTICYGCAYASRGRKGVPKPKRKKDEWEEDDQKSNVTKNRGRYGYGSSVA